MKLNINDDNDNKNKKNLINVTFIQIYSKYL